MENNVYLYGIPGHFQSHVVFLNVYCAYYHSLRHKRIWTRGLVDLEQYLINVQTCNL